MKKRAPKCVECGKGLPVAYAEVNDPSKMPPDEPGTKRVAIGRGFNGDGLLCSGKCGYTMAVRWLRRLYFWR